MRQLYRTSWVQLGAASVTTVAKDVSTAMDYKFRLVFTIDPVRFGRLIPPVPNFSQNYGANKYALTWINMWQQTDRRNIIPLRGIQGGPSGWGIEHRGDSR